MEIFEQQPQQWTGIPPDRPSRPSATWLMFATILGMLIGGAIIYFTVDTSPEIALPPADTTTVATTATVESVPSSTKAAPLARGAAIDAAYETTYPVEGSTTGFIALTNGSATEALSDSNSTLQVDVADAVAADLDGDGTDDAVVILSVDTGGPGIFHYAYGVFADPNQTLVTNAVALGDRIDIDIDTTSVDPITGTATVRYRDHSEKVAFTDAPDLLVVSDLQILRSGAQEVARGSIPLADTTDPQLTSANTITTGGLGPVRVEMTVEEATKAAGLVIIAPTASADSAGPGDCGFARADGIEGVGFMLVDGVIKRVDVFSGATSTASGAKIGSTEQEIKDLFPEIITVSPHQYVENGHYLTLTPTAETLTDFRVVFETDGAVVTSYRSGKTPQVEWVEGCA